MSNKENREVLIQSKKCFIIKFIVSILLIVLLLIIPIYYSYSIDAIIALNYNKAYLMFITLGVFFISYRIIEMVNQKTFYILYSSLYKTYMNKGLIKTCNNSLHSLSRFSLSEYSNIMSEDFELLSEFYSTLVIRIVEILQFIYIIIYFFIINSIIGFITVNMSIIVILILVYYNGKISSTNEIRKQKNDQRISIFQEIFLSLKEIKGFNIFNIVSGRINKQIDSYIKWNNKLNVDKYNLRQVSLGIVDVFRIISLCIGVGLIVKGNMTVGVITIIYNYYAKLSDLSTSIITLMEGIINVKVARKRIYKLFQYATDREIDAKNINEVIGNITFANIVYGDKTGSILNDVSFNIGSNSLTVMTGNIGNCLGIYDLLLRYNEQHSGSILIDELDLGNYSQESIGNVIGFVMEYPTFFNTSIRDNLLIFDSNFENVVNICKELNIHDYIMSLPEGYETILSNNAGNIDSDVKYLLAFVRVFLLKSKIILLEEVLDKVSNDVRKQILSIIKTIKNEHTIIMISRDRQLIGSKFVNKVIVFSKGTVLANGIYKDIINNEKVGEILKKM